MFSLSMEVHATATIQGLDVLADAPKQEELWRNLALIQRNENILPPKGRIATRMDIDGRQYPESLRAMKDAKKGRKHGGGGAYTLWDQGLMLPSITVAGVTPFGSRLGFNSVREALKAGWNHFDTVRRGIRRKGRAFWGFARADMDRLEDYKEKYLDEALNRSGLR